MIRRDRHSSRDASDVDIGATNGNSQPVDEARGRIAWSMLRCSLFHERRDIAIFNHHDHNDHVKCDGTFP